ncbi:hypothetical protein ACFS4T_25890 [Pseudomonas lini]
MVQIEVDIICQGTHQFFSPTRDLYEPRISVSAEKKYRLYTGVSRTLSILEKKSRLAMALS